MRTIYKLGLFLLLFLSSTIKAEDLTGFWQVVDKKTSKPRSVIAVYPYKGNYYGRIIATYNQQGVMDDTIYHPKDKAPGVEGKPYYSGLDIVWTTSFDDDRYKGQVIDPKEGKVYKAELWKEGGNLILRGEVFIFGRNEVWPPFPESNFNKNFKKPDLSTFVPKIPKVTND